ncbi:polysaccharide biosynthesis tyrosine autokinase [Gordonia amicalis]|uniref:polysaccharide biosynthesis tyrosine autokinase n=1 Tax=Gordonia amicalis TaxID=89053 RepID=UPI0022B49311|nr:polysaccharide biosynthesis tyrosine autokinase [Gordonia amicalis]MCZ4653826.1 polysaccharide biosynthesis tyrosine autokinase [Gordonia amicalis]
MSAAIAVGTRWWVVAVSALLAGCLALGVSLLQVPVYAASSTLYVTSTFSEDSASAAYQGSMASQQRVASYIDLVKSDSVIRDALSSSGLVMTVSEAKSALNATSKPATVLLTITARDTDPEVARRLVDAVSEAMSRRVTDLETPASGGVPLAKLTVVAPGTVNTSPVRPATSRNVALGLFGGALFGVLFVLARRRFDTRIRDVAELELVSGAALLSSVPMESQLSNRGVVEFHQGSSAAAEAYRRLRANLSYVDVDSPATRVLVTSGMPGEGKTTTALNLGASLAEAGIRVLVVDADLRKPSIADSLGVSGGIGLTTYLRGDIDLASCIQSTVLDGLDVLASGVVPPNPAELLGSMKAASLMSNVPAGYDFVLIDSPPVLPVADSSVLAQYVDGVLLVVRAGHTHRDDLEETVLSLEKARARVLGTVMNAVEVSTGSGTRYGYYGASVEV